MKVGGPTPVGGGLLSQSTQLSQNFTQFLHESGLGETILDILHVPLVSGSHCPVSVSPEGYRMSGFLEDDLRAFAVFNANAGSDSCYMLASVVEAVGRFFPRFSM